LSVAHHRDAVGRLEIDADQGARSAQRILRVDPCAGPVDADHLGSVIGEHHAGERPRPDPGQLDDAQAGERSHRRLPAAVMAGRGRTGKHFTPRLPHIVIPRKREPMTSKVRGQGSRASRE
jgi:hypothetical protein